MSIVSYGGSYIGRRPNNEDSIGRTIPRDPLVLDAKGRLYLVCDGMGGTTGGEVASRIAVETIMDRYYADNAGEDALTDAVRAASAAIAARAQEDTSLADMGSTVVALAVFADRFVYAHVGDSRLYLLRDGELSRLTRDHLHIIDDLGVSEEEAETHPYKNVLSRALGYLDACEPVAGSMASRCGDRLLLCSDGLSDTLDRDAIQAALEQPTPQCAVERLLDAAAAGNARDNATALAVFVLPENAIEEPTQRLAFGPREVLSSPDVEATSRNPIPWDAPKALQRSGRVERK